MTRRQARLVVTTQASLLAIIGLLVGVPLGMALGRAIWRAVAGFTPLAYHSPLALLALLLVGPVALPAANGLATWPQRRAAGVALPMSCGASEQAPERGWPGPGWPPGRLRTI